MKVRVQNQVELAPLTTLQLGGTAGYFLAATSLEEIVQGLSFAKDSRIPVCILGGGSNTIFSDAGFPGLVLQIQTRGMEVLQENVDSVIVDVSAGEDWDGFVLHCIEHGWAGVECLSGIPGSVGAVPIQNVGAYGQEVSQTIVSVRCLDRITFEQVVFSAEECEFDYRQSRFKSYDRDRYIVLSVAFQLSTRTIQEPRYHELKQALVQSGESFLEGASIITMDEDRKKNLLRLREAVISLRRKKSMVIDPMDPESRSAGSFFLNPVIQEAQLQDFRSRMEDAGFHDYPCYESQGKYKLSAAWLVENAGFPKGYTENGVGISRSHSLALVNRKGSSRALLELSRKIQKKVFDFSGVWLEREPVIAGAEE